MKEGENQYPPMAGNQKLNNRLKKGDLWSVIVPRKRGEHDTGECMRSGV